MSLAELQNGSDIRGIAVAGIAGEEVNLGKNEARYLTAAFATWLGERSGKPLSALKVAVGCDSRISGPELKGYVCETLADFDVKVLDCGLASTPALFMSTVFPETDCDAGICVTASHMPFNRNGLKYFTRDGGLEKADISAVIELAENRDLQYVCDEGKKSPYRGLFKKKKADNQVATDLMSLYAAHLRSVIIKGAGLGEEPLRGLKIAVDAGNGAGGFYANEVLAPLGADVSASQFLEPNGMFPNHIPNPEDKNAMESIRARVLETGADFGLIFDTDVDRSAAVDGSGKEIARNGIVALAAALVAEDHPGTTVVTDSVTSDGLTDFLEKDLGLKHFRFKRGYRNVINKGIELNEAGTPCYLAIETSGHAAFKENYFLDDGAYLAARIAIKAAKLAREGKTLESLIAGMKEPAEALEFRIPLGGGDFSAVADRVLSGLGDWAEKTEGVSVVEPSYEGVRLNFAAAQGWCLLRKSLHEPLLPLNIESNVPGGAEQILNLLRSYLETQDLHV